MIQPVSRRAAIALWILLAASLAAACVPQGAVSGIAALLLGWLPVAFALVHVIVWLGARYGLLTLAIIAVVSFTYEALGVATGLVFGDYYYPDGPLGPLLLGVPPLIQLQYFAMGYACLVAARAVSGTLWRPARGWMLVGTSAMAAMGMTALDLASDPMQSTVLGDWIWRDGGAYFGVPLHNFIGWFVCTVTFFLIINAVLLRRSAEARIEARRPTWFYGMGLGLFATFPLAIVLRPLSDAAEIPLAMCAVALFAVCPILLAAFLSLAREAKT